MIIFVDIDKTICDKPDNFDYGCSTPNQENIAKINKLYKKGNYIIYWTARGALKNESHTWFQFTEKQLHEWGCLYHELRMGKPYYDMIIDDKAFRIENIP